MEILGFLTPAGRDSPSVFGMGDIKWGYFVICMSDEQTKRSVGELGSTTKVKRFSVSPIAQKTKSEFLFSAYKRRFSSGIERGKLRFSFYHIDDKQRFFLKAFLSEEGGSPPLLRRDGRSVALYGAESAPYRARGKSRGRTEGQLSLTPLREQHPENRTAK